MTKHRSLKTNLVGRIPPARVLVRLAQRPSPLPEITSLRWLKVGPKHVTHRGRVRAFAGPNLVRVPALYGAPRTLVDTFPQGVYRESPIIRKVSLFCPTKRLTPPAHYVKSAVTIRQGVGAQMGAGAICSREEVH